LKKAVELRKLILLSKAFLALKNKTQHYKRVKDFIIHNLCMQKMKSKIKVFSILKTNYRDTVDDNRKQTLAMGHRAITLIQKHLKKWQKIS
jgi:uncharacterized protein YerC